MKPICYIKEISLRLIVIVVHFGIQKGHIFFYVNDNAYIYENS